MSMRYGKKVFGALKNHNVLYRCYTISSRNILDLHDRGIFRNVFPTQSAPELRQRLVSKEQCVYCGFDPTADSLHVGNLLAIIALLHCQRAGHRPIALIGGATAHIGDPTGRNTARDYMEIEVIENNIKKIRKCLQQIIENHEVYFCKQGQVLPEIRILNNADWYNELNVIEFLAKVGRSFRLSNLLHRSSVKARMESADGMSFTEFTYQIFQAYDWLHLYKLYDCSIQIGGNDQLGNINAGYELIRDVLNKKVFGLTVPLITTSDGEKLGKTANNAIWLDENKTSPYELYQYFLNLTDKDALQYIKLFTFLPDSEIQDLLHNYENKPEQRSKRPMQKKIADSVVTLVHGEDGLQTAQRCTKALFERSPEALADLHQRELVMLFRNSHGIDLFLDPGTTIMDVVMKAQCFVNESDAQNTIESGGLWINNRRVRESQLVLLPGEHILPNNITVIRVGKRNHYLVRWLT